jgi:2-polyprenyl-6-methoxyphenol hydroxylase-like FAD-dependent oxidoreductase
MMAGLLFARAGCEVLVLEKHADFFRDFRGDTVHPSTMEILDELAMLDRFLKRPHNRIEKAEVSWNGQLMQIGDLTHLKMPAPFIAMMPQWDFLDFLRDEAAHFSGFHLRMEAPVECFLERGGTVTGVRLSSGEEIRATLTIAADGRDSIVRKILPLENLGAPIDVFWVAVPKTVPGNALRGAVRGYRLIVMIDRGDYWQCAFVIAKGGAEQVRARGIQAFRDDLRAVAPDLPNLDKSLPDFDHVRLLSVSLDRLTRWDKPGLLAIGDAAHAMSPVGGIGINLAIQDAVCAANVLAGKLSRHENVHSLLHEVRDRRFLPTKVIQSAQRFVHERILLPLIEGRRQTPEKPPLPMRLLNRFSMLRRIPGYFIGHGIRQEHVHSRRLRLRPDCPPSPPRGCGRLPRRTARSSSTPVRVRPG